MKIEAYKQVNTDTGDLLIWSIIESPLRILLMLNIILRMISDQRKIKNE